MLDLANDVPDTISLYGIDISPHLFPPSPPPNVQFLATSITQLPVDWTSTFTLVHQRLLLAGLSHAAWQAAFSEMYRVLVPGGWINLFELNGDVDRIDYTGGPAIIKTMTIIREAFRKAGAVADVVYHIPGWLEKIGFTNIHVERRRASMSGEEGRAMRENKYRVYMGIKTPVLSAGGFGR